MRINHLHLKAFRNYHEISLDFSDGVQIFIGENAQGKTNLMESIHTLAMTKSHRTNNDRELINFGENQTTIKGIVQKKISTISMELQISKKGKKARINHLEQRKLSTYIGNLNLVLFAPEHLNLIKGGPIQRRKFIDMELGQINPIYLNELVEYQKILKQRNMYLKQIYLKKSSDLVYLDVLTEQLAIIASSLIKFRVQFLEELEKLTIPIHYHLSNQKEHFSLLYKTSLDLDESLNKKEIFEKLMDQFSKIQKREIEQMTTLIGPHREDIIFYINQKDVSIYGSQGQQRLIVLSLKLAEIELMMETIGEYPILLLDDVLSELDNDRQTLLIQAIENKVQTFLTTTNLDGVKKQFIHPPNIFTIKNGEICD